MTDRAASPRRHRWADLALTLLFTAAVGWTYLTGARLNHPHWLSPKADSYYALLTEALLDGQFHLKLTPVKETIKNRQDH